MDISAYFLAVLFLFCISWREAYSLICHVCHSGPDRDGAACMDPFTNNTFLRDCKSFNPSAKSCRKIAQKVLGEYTVIRQCSHEEAPLECVDRIGTKYVRVKHCHCADSYCNDANIKWINALMGPFMALFHHLVTN